MERFARTGFPAAPGRGVAVHADRAHRPGGPGGRPPAQPTSSTPGAAGAVRLRPRRSGRTLVFVNGVVQRGTERPSASCRRASGSTSLAEALRADGALLRAHLTRHAPVEGSPFTALNTALPGDGGVVHVRGRRRPGAPGAPALRHHAGGRRHRRPSAQPDRGGAGRPGVGHRELRDPAPRARPTGPTRSPKSRRRPARGWSTPGSSARASAPTTSASPTSTSSATATTARSRWRWAAALARHNLHVRLNDENIETLMYGLYLTRGEQVADNHTAIYHDQPNCRSWEVYKGVLDGRSRAVFNGKVFVKPEAQKTDAKQTNRNLLLSDRAKVDTKPQLEIFADDVKCTHGATVGRLDDVGPFYARSRGIPRGGRRAAPDLRLRGRGGGRGGARAGAARSSTAWCSSAWAASGSLSRCRRSDLRSRPSALPAARRRRGSAGTFPILAQQVRGKPLVYLDNAATSQKPQAVIDAVTRFYATENANIHRGVHYLSEQATAAYDAGARSGWRASSTRRRPAEIVFTRGTTEGDQPRGPELGPRAAPAGRRDPHHRPWSTTPTSSPGSWWPRRPGRCCAPSRSPTRASWIWTAFASPAHRPDPARSPSPTSPTRWARINPVRWMVAEAPGRGASSVLVDGAQSAPHLPVDVQALGCDFFAFSGHKVFGPTGVGVLYGRAELLEAMPPWQGGGDMIETRDARALHLGRASRPVRGRHAADRRGDRARARRSTTSTAIGREAIGAWEDELLALRRPSGSARAPGVRLIGTAPREGRRALVRGGWRPPARRRARCSTTRASRSGPATTAPSR